MNINKTKSCPFCDGVNLNFNADDKRLMCDTVECNGCGALVPSAEWNTRLDGWIEVEDRLPSDDESWCLVYADGAMNCMMFYNGRFYDPTHSKCHNINIDEITYWMPLPNQPKAASCGE